MGNIPVRTFAKKEASNVAESGEEKPKRKRATKAEMEARKLAKE